MLLGNVILDENLKAQIRMEAFKTLYKCEPSRGINLIRQLDNGQIQLNSAQGTVTLRFIMP